MPSEPNGLGRAQSLYRGKCGFILTQTCQSIPSNPDKRTRSGGIVQSAHRFNVVSNCAAKLIHFEGCECHPLRIIAEDRFSNLLKNGRCSARSSSIPRATMGTHRPAS